MPVSIKGTGGGSVTLDAGAAAADTTITLPNTTGTVALTASPTFTGTTTVTTLTATTITSPSATALTFQYGGTTGATLDTSGNLLVGRTTNPSGLSNGLYVLGTYSNITPSAANVFINTDGSFFRSTSSLRYEANVQDATHGLADLLKLRSVTYNGKNDRDAQTVFGGFIAEEVDAAGLNEFVVYDEDGKPDALQYGNMVALMAKAIQELSAKNDALEARLAALEVK